jgi:hypothetical protein
MSIELALFEELAEEPFGELSAATSGSQGEAVWAAMIGRITQAFSRHDQMAGAIALLEQRGVNTSSVRTTHATWMTRIEELFAIIVKVIKENKTVQAAIDAAAAAVDYSKRIIGLADVAPLAPQPVPGTWQRIVRTLDPNLRRYDPRLNGLGELGWVQVVAPAFMAMWPTIAPILLRVATTVAIYVAGSQIASIVSSISGEVENRGKALESCLEHAKKFTDKQQAQAALDSCQALAQPVSGMNWLLVGGAAGVLALLYFQNKKGGL